MSTTESTLTLQVVDAMELAEVCDYLIEWLGTAPTAVGEDLARFGADNAAPVEVCRTLARFAGLLTTAPCHGRQR